MRLVRLMLFASFVFGLSCTSEHSEERVDSSAQPPPVEPQTGVAAEVPAGAVVSGDEGSGPLAYEVADRDEYVYVTIRRVTYKLVVDHEGVPPDASLRATAEAFWVEAEDKGWPEFNVLLYLPEMPLSDSAYAKALFGPVGLHTFVEPEGEEASGR